MPGSGIAIGGGGGTGRTGIIARNCWRKSSAIRSASARPRMTFGRMNTISSVRTLMSSRLRKAAPITGRSPRIGKLSFESCDFSCTSPPSARVWPSFTATLVATRRWRIVGELIVEVVVGTTSLTSWLMSRTTRPFLFNGVVAQRLVRILCDACAAPLPATERERLALGVPATAPLRLRRPCGCPACNGTGYRGRRVVSEVMLLDGELRGMIAERAGERAIAARARAGGMVPLAESGRLLAAGGRTSLDEVGRVLEGL